MKRRKKSVESALESVADDEYHSDLDDVFADSDDADSDKTNRKRSTTNLKQFNDKSTVNASC
jgi:hypothetical protein